MKKVDSTELYDGIRLLVLSARQAVARGVNLLQVHTNYEIGRRIVLREQGGADRAQYGKEVIKELAERLTSEFGNGFSKSNLEYMRRFYLAYPGRNIQIAQTLSGRFAGLENEPAPSIAQTASGQCASSGAELPFLLGLKDQERRFYEIQAAEQGWILRDLKRQFNAGLYERLALSRDIAEGESCEFFSLSTASSIRQRVRYATGSPQRRGVAILSLSRR
jgi:hypothetical protein